MLFMRRIPTVGIVYRHLVLALEYHVFDICKTVRNWLSAIDSELKAIACSVINFQKVPALSSSYNEF